MKSPIGKLNGSLQKKIKALQADVTATETASKALLKKITGHSAPLIRMTKLESQYMAAVKKSDGLVIGKPSTVKALKAAEKETTKAKVAAAIGAIEAEVKAAKKDNAADKKFKAFAAAAQTLVGSLKSIKLK